MNKNTQQFIRELSFAKKYTGAVGEEEVVKTSKAASSLAVVYESARNAVEFKAEHLIRQGAISRILRRRLLLNQPSRKLASLLIRELIWARYIKQSCVSETKIEEVIGIIEKYRHAISQTPRAILNQKKKDNDLVEWLIGLASCEIEEKLAFNPIPQILINYVFASLSERIDFEEEDPQTKNAQIYIATERGFAKNSEVFISFRLLKTLLPQWFQAEIKLDDSLYNQLVKTRLLIITQLNYPLKDELRRTVTKMSAPFNLMREMLDEYPDDFGDIVSDKESLEKTAGLVLENRYSVTRERLSRASSRSIIYIFLTKMLLALLLELPFDLFWGRTNYLALGINTIFPPFLMFLLNMNVKLPDSENSLRIINKIKEYFYEENTEKIIFISGKSIQSRGESVFFALYLVTFVLIFGSIVWVLRLFNFNFVSIVIFLFFLTVVSFFAYRVRGIAKDYLLPEEGKEGISSSLLDFIFLPIIKVGQWLSIQIAYINILSFILDFIIEAPLKTFLEVFEDWIHFVRVKKEEIVT